MLHVLLSRYKSRRKLFGFGYLFRRYLAFDICKIFRSPSGAMRHCNRIPFVGFYFVFLNTFAILIAGSKVI